MVVDKKAEMESFGRIFVSDIELSSIFSDAGFYVVLSASNGW